MIMPVPKGLILVSKEKYWLTVNGYDDNLRSKSGKSRFDIKEIYGFSVLATRTMEFDINDRALLWKREETKKEMTVAEIEKELGYSIKIVKESEEN